MFDTSDTICAISTAAGAGWRAIVRLSGPRAIEIVEDLFRPFSGRLAELGGFRWTDGIVSAGLSRHGGEQIKLPARAYVFRCPKSYTRQDLVELHVPGAIHAAGAVLDAMLAAGARRAEGGEFTARAFLSGRIDLSAAQAVADLIDSAGAAQARAAAAAACGQIFRICTQLAGELADALACVEAAIDLADQDIHLDQPATLAARLETLAGRIAMLAESADDMPDESACPRVVLAGRPNVGKSSLLNALAQTDRAIVSALAGTTRDVLNCPISISNVGLLLLDAAGFAAPKNDLDGAAQSAAERAVASADLVLLVVDAGAGGGDLRADREILDRVGHANPRASVILLANKLDLAADQPGTIEKIKSTAGVETLGVSALTGLGLDELRTAIANHLHLGAWRGGETLALHKRQKACLIDASRSASAAAEILKNSGEVADDAELVAIELREAMASIGKITGQVGTEEILARIFSRFCVGK
ncbi:MAG: 50S ribosome-binding GTPase [Planctomycetes bacterium]|nr:50S ribosome-binding GTPase [Planctomycetota bacterium]